MSYLTIKCIAVVCMLIDHIGYISGIFIFRAIGRISFPIFAFLVSNGLKHTHSTSKYALRMFFFALISEIPYDLMAKSRISLNTFDNVFFTLLLGLLFLILLKELKIKFEKKPWLVFIISLPVLAVLCITAIIISCDYTWIGVLTVVLFGIFDSQNKKQQICLLLGSVLLAGWNLWSYIIYALVGAIGFDLHSVIGGGILFASRLPSGWSLLQLLRIAALVPIFFYNGKSGQPENKITKKAFQYGFYLFYPVHMLILYFINLIIM